MKAGDLDPVPAALHQSGQHTNGIPEQGGVGRMMDVALNTGAVDAHLAALFDFLILGIAEQSVLIISQVSADMALMFLFRADFLNPLSAMPMRQNQFKLGVHQMKGQLLVGEAEKGFHNGASAAPDRHSCRWHLAVSDIFTPVQILKNTAADGRVGVNDVADGFQLFALGMVGYLGHQRHLFLPFFAHFVIGSFLICSDIGCLATFNILQ
jgi:hypothetical protein